MKRKYAGQLLAYFLVKDRELPYHYAYGIRHSEQYGAHFIRTTPITHINHQERKLFTLYSVYTIHYLIPDENYKELICKLFSEVETPLSDDELIIARMSLSRH